jgi:ribonuclease Y
MDPILSFISGFAVACIATIVIVVIKKNLNRKNILLAEELAKKIVEDAKIDAENQKKTVVLKAKEDWFKIQENYENEIKARKKELHSLEKDYNDRVNKLDNRTDNLDNREKKLSDFERRLSDLQEKNQIKERELEEVLDEQNRKLSEIARLSREEAVEILKNNLKNKARQQAAKDLRKIAEQTKLEANNLAAGIISTAVQRIAVDYVSETTVSVVSLPDDEMKGRIIGREGRNIRAFEKASGIDLIIDDTPEAVVLSGFDPVRREVARLSLEKLISDGRIHPGRIEHVIAKTAKEMDESLMKVGEQACIETNIHNISPNIVKLIGRLKYRTSYGQNILQHSIEAAWVCGILAAELGLDQELARRCGFLHDLGKAIDHEFDGSHAKLGANVARKNGESKIVVNAIEAHHEEVEYQSVYAVLAQVADAISGARPGARREMLETYMKRLEKLEEIANSIEGVNKSFAIQAGRELRIIVDPTKVSDNKSSFIASDIAARIEEEMQYPGQIKVMVIRETRQTAVAK